MKKLLALLTAALLVAALAVPAMADNYGDDTSTIGKTVDGTQTVLDKYLVLDQGTETPTVKFQYDVSVPASVGTVGDLDIAVQGEEGSEQYVPVETGALFDASLTYYSDDQGTVSATIVDQDTLDAAISAGEAFVKTTKDATMQVYVGINPEKVKVNKNDPAQKGYVEFSAADDADTDVDKGNKGDPGNPKVVEDAMGDGQRFLRKDIELDFSDITFTEPGIYRYYLVESVAADSETPAGLFIMDSETSDDKASEGILWRTVDVYVENVYDDAADKDNLTIYDDKAVYPYSYVVYEGKLTGAPKQDINFEYNSDYTSDGGNFDPNEEVSGYEPANDTWIYPLEAAKDPSYAGEKYIYTYDKNNGGWVEQYFNAAGDERVRRNVTTNLQDAFAKINPAFEAETAGEAYAMGATKDDITSKNWQYQSQEPGAQSLQITGTWDPNSGTDGQWIVTGEGTDVADAPNDKAKPVKRNAADTDWEDVDFVYTNNQGQQVIVKTDADKEYKALKDDHVADSEMQKYIWRFIDSDGLVTDTFIYKYNAQTGTWDVEITVDQKQNYLNDDNTPFIPDAAIPVDDDGNLDPLVVDYVKYSYWEPIEQAAQQANSPGYTDALKYNPNGAEVEGSDKNSVYVNKYETVDVTISKTVEGNQGSRDKYFKFTVKMTKTEAAGVIINTDRGEGNLDLEPTENVVTEYSATDMKAANSLDEQSSTTDTYEYAFDSNDEIEFDIYLQGGQSITLKGVPAGTVYSVTEADKDKDGYKTTAKITRKSAGTTDYEDGSDVTIIQDNHLVAYTNTKNGVIPTGVAVGIIGGAVLVGIAAIYLVLRRRMSMYEE